MPVTDWKAPGTAVSTGGGNIPWANVNNAKTDDNNYAYADLQYAYTTRTLLLTNFGFTTSDIPAGSSIDGIEVQYRKLGENGNSIKDLSVRLYLDGGVLGDSKADTVNFWAATKTTYTYPSSGGSSDDWNAGLADSDIRSSTFGVGIRGMNFYDAYRMARIYFAQIRIHYTPPAADHRRSSFFKMF